MLTGVRVSAPPNASPVEDRETDGIYYSVTESRLLEAKRKFELYLKKSLL